MQVGSDFARQEGQRFSSFLRKLHGAHRVSTQGIVRTDIVTTSLRLAVALSLVLLLSAASQVSAQVVHRSGQSVVPVYQGWEPNADGTFTLVFGYFNRNSEEEPFVPVGPNNMFEPGAPDRGQPTHFYTRRQQFLFKVQVPKDFGHKELVWTLISNGITEKTYGTLLPVYELGEVVYEQNRGGTLLHGPNEPENHPPSIKLVSSPQAMVPLSDTLNLTVSVTDDGLPLKRPRPTQSSQNAGAAARAARGRPGGGPVLKLAPGTNLGVTFVHHRGPGRVTFEPGQAAIEDGKAGQATTKVSFSEPGVYVIRAYADDGVLTDSVDVSVTAK